MGEKQVAQALVMLVRQCRYLLGIEIRDGALRRTVQLAGGVAQRLLHHTARDTGRLAQLQMRVDQFRMIPSIGLRVEVE